MKPRTPERGRYTPGARRMPRVSSQG